MRHWQCVIQGGASVRNISPTSSDDDGLLGEEHLGGENDGLHENNDHGGENDGLDGENDGLHENDDHSGENNGGLLENGDSSIEALQ
ncbi:hypothetical protein Dimus_022698 [Dionaea muscipula]